ncbi:hypothetical protein [Xenorhabdus bovienii]|uniref:hypothetical protein n=1 Tax=Xenorhabdus bovienii TaxID=40576 RepID=UPI0012D36C12|nr:hypothetical protein [Xenorhabdus bovienii]
MKVTIEVPDSKDIPLAVGAVQDHIKSKDREINLTIPFYTNTGRSGRIRESHKGNITCRIYD